MSGHMILQCPSLCEGHIADVADMRPLSSVNDLVTLQSTSTSEHLLTDFAGVNSEELLHLPTLSCLQNLSEIK